MHELLRCRLLRPRKPQRQNQLANVLTTIGCSLFVFLDRSGGFRGPCPNDATHYDPAASVREGDLSISIIEKLEEAQQVVILQIEPPALQQLLDIPNQVVQQRPDYTTARFWAIGS